MCSVYIYTADLYCEDCGVALREMILGESAPEFDPDDETTYDSDEFPKGPYEDGGGEADSPHHCGSGAECCNAITLKDGSKVGAFLENPLTCEGQQYVRDAIADFHQQGRGQEEVLRLWAEYYNLPFDPSDDE